MLLPQTRFAAMLIEVNGLDPDDFKCWVFSPGMLFDAPDKWWGDYGRRDFPHEGIDFCLYRDAADNLRRLDEGTRIPVMHDGRVRALFADYLGQGVVIEHDRISEIPEKAISIYAHTKPLAGILPGVKVREGDIIARIADTGRSRTNILPHLHFSLGRPSPEIGYDAFAWNHMRDPGLVKLINPQSLIDGPFELLGHERRDLVFTSVGTGGYPIKPSG